MSYLFVDCCKSPLLPIQLQDKPQVFTGEEKFTLFTDIFLVAIAGLVATLAILYAEGLVDLGPLNATLNVITPHVARYILAGAGGLLVLDVVKLIVKLRSHIDHQQDHIHSLRDGSDRQSLVDQIGKLETEKAEIRANAQDCLDKLNGRNTEKKNRIVALTGQLIAAQDELTTAQNTYDAKLEEEKGLMQKEYDLLQEKCDLVKQQLEDIKKLEKLSALAAKKGQKGDTATEKILGTLGEQNRELREKVLNAYDKVSKKDGIEDLNAKIAKIDTDIAQRTIDLDSLDQRINTLTEQQGKLAYELDTARKAAKADADAEVAKILAAGRIKSDEILNNAHEEARELVTKAEQDMLKAEQDMLKAARVQDEEARQERETTRLDQLKDVEAEKKRLQQKNAELKASIDDLDRKISKLKDRHGIASAELDNAREQAAAATRQAGAMAAEYKATNEKVAALRNEQTTLTNETKTLEQTKLTLTSENQTLTQQAEKLKKENAAIEQQRQQNSTNKS